MERESCYSQPSWHCGESLSKWEKIHIFPEKYTILIASECVHWTEENTCPDCFFDKGENGNIYTPLISVDGALHALSSHLYDLAPTASSACDFLLLPTFTPSSSLLV